MRPLVTLALLVSLATVPSLALTAVGITVTGEVVEIACATTKGPDGRGQGHASCALACAKRGEPVGILTDSAIYEITGDFTAGNNARLLDFIAKSVTATGELVERDGKRLLNVRTIRVN